jgi:stage II sporulation protein AA (anti-sigma F factor antagonist)
MKKPKFFRVEQVGDTLIFSAVGSVGTLVEDEAREEWEAMLDQIDKYDAKHAILDLGSLDYFGSIMLYLMVRLWKRVSDKEGKLAICQVSKVGREILETAKFDSMWPIVDSRDAAIEAVHG